MLLILITIFISVTFSLKNTNKEVIDVTEFGAKPNDLTDDTEAIQDAVDYAAKVGGIVHFPKGTFMVNADPISGTIKLNDNQEIRMEKETTLKVIPNSLSNHVIFLIKDKQNVKISGGNLKGDRYEHQSNKGEYGHGIIINGNSQNVVISDLHLSDFWGDGIYIGGNETYKTYPSNIKIINCIADNNRRQGLSITAGKYIIVQDSTFSNTNGTAPEAGIDLERNAPYQLPLENVTLSNNKLINNNGYGLMFVYTNNNMAENNKILKNKKGGVYLGGEANNVKTNKNTVANNTINDNGGDTSTELSGNGVFLNFASDNTITDNEIFNNKTNGVHLLNRVGNNVIENNLIEQNDESGIVIWGGSDHNNDIIVQENTIDNNLKFGLSLSRVRTAQILKNEFNNNREYQMFLDNVSDSIVQSNEISSDSMKIRNSTNNKIDNNS
jgi:parallel beta-helix repeat protein